MIVCENTFLDFQMFPVNTNIQISNASNLQRPRNLWALAKGKENTSFVIVTHPQQIIKIRSSTCLPNLLASAISYADNNVFMLATSSLTASTLFWKLAFSVSVNFSSMIFSMPPVPMMHGTPT